MNHAVLISNKRYHLLSARITGVPCTTPHRTLPHKSGTCVPAPAFTPEVNPLALTARIARAAEHVIVTRGTRANVSYQETAALLQEYGETFVR